MSQAGYTPIQLYYSTTAAAVPTAGNLASGELAINITDGKLYYKNNSGTVTLLAGSGGGGPAAGSNTQIQFNNSGVFGASSSLTWDGTYLTAGSIKDSALTSGRVTFAGASGLLTDSANLTFNGTDLTVSGAVNAGTINATTLDLTNLEVTNIKAKDGTASITLADSTGVASFTANPVLSGGTASGVLYLNGSKVATSGSALVFDGTRLKVGGAPTANANYIQSSLGISAGGSVAAQGTFSGFSGAGIFMSYEGSYGRLEAYDYGTSAYKDVYIVPNGGNVGLGAAANTLKLNVYQGTAGVGAFKAAHVNGNQIEIAPSYNYYDAYNHIFRSLSATTEYARFLNTGFFGIGTTNPITQFVVSNAGAVGFEVSPSGSGVTLTSYNRSGGAYAPISLIGSVGQSLNINATGTYLNSTLGIGVPVPNGTLSIAGGGNINSQNAILYIDANAAYSAGADRYIASSFASRYAMVNGVHSFQIAPSGTAGNPISFTTPLSIAATGRITMNPSEYTVINGSVYAKTPSATGFSLGFNPSGGNGEAQLVWGTGGATYPFIISSYDGSSTTERARFSTDGVLQVGRTGGSAPDGKIQVGATGTGAGAANTKLGFALIEDDSGNGAGLWLGSMTNENTGVIGTRTASGNLAFQTYNGGWGERMRLTYTGRLGIGNTSPTNMLDVSGTVGKRYTSNVTVTNNNTSTAVLNPFNGQNFSNWLGTNFNTGGPCTGTISITWDTGGSASSAIFSFAKHSGFNGANITLMSSTNYNGDTTTDGSYIYLRNNGSSSITPVFSVLLTTQ